MCNPDLPIDVYQEPDGQVELPDGSRVALNLIGRLPFCMGSECIILCSEYYIPGLNLNIISCPILDENDTTKTIKNGVRRLTDRRDCAVLAKNDRRKSDGLVVITLLLHSRQKLPETDQN